MSDTLGPGLVQKQANIYFDGKCVSHAVTLPDGSRKTVGVIFPAQLTFTTGAAERMELVAGACQVRLPGQAWKAFRGGQHFDVPANSQFDIDVSETLHYVCHFL